MDIAGKVAIVTGTATGVGRGIASDFVRAGAKVVMADVDPAGAGLVDELADAAGEARFVQADVSNPDDARKLAEVAREDFGGLHILVNNAAIQVEKTIEDVEPDEWDRLMSINVKGVYLCIKYAIPVMRASGGGSIVNVASVNGFWVEPGLAAYCTSKGAVITLTRAVACEVGRDNIRCNAICPGYIDTGMAARYLDSQPDPEKARAEVAQLHTVGRVGQPADIAAFARFLASDASSFATGAIYPLDGGLSIGVSAKPDQDW